MLSYFFIIPAVVFAQVADDAESNARFLRPRRSKTVGSYKYTDIATLSGSASECIGNNETSCLGAMPGNACAWNGSRCVTNCRVANDVVLNGKNTCGTGDYRHCEVALKGSMKCDFDLSLMNARFLRGSRSKKMGIYKFKGVARMSGSASECDGNNETSCLRALPGNACAWNGSKCVTNCRVTMDVVLSGKNTCGAGDYSHCVESEKPGLKCNFAPTSRALRSRRSKKSGNFKFNGIAKVSGTASECNGNDETSCLKAMPGNACAWNGSKCVTNCRVANDVVLSGKNTCGAGDYSHCQASQKSGLKCDFASSANARFLRKPSRGNKKVGKYSFSGYARMVGNSDDCSAGDENTCLRAPGKSCAWDAEDRKCVPNCKFSKRSGANTDDCGKAGPLSHCVVPVGKTSDKCTFPLN